MEHLRLEDDENENWEQAEGVPKLSDQFIQKYLQGRDALVAQEKKQRSGSWYPWQRCSRTRSDRC